MEREDKKVYQRDYETPPPTPPNNNRSSNIVGAVIIILGIMLLLRSVNLGNWFPNWIFGWELIMIIIGLVIGVNSKFEKKSAIVLLAIGGLFFLRKLLGISFAGGIVPLAAIILGIYLIMRNRQAGPAPFDPKQGPRQPEKDMFDWDKRVDVPSEDAFRSPFDRTEESATAGPDHAQHQDYHSFAGENHIKVDSVFGNARKIIFSKNFLGGTMTNIFGSTEINLLQADVQQPIALDVFQLFGSTKIIVPPHWVIHTSVSSILSENDDRRVILSYAVDQKKSLYITGTSIFGSITIKNS